MSLNALGSFITMMLYQHIMLFIVSCMLLFKIALLSVFFRLVTLCM